jgi:hypothetical protein
VIRNRSKTRGVIAGLVPAISIWMAQCPTIGMAGTSLDKPGRDQAGLPRILLLFRDCSAFGWLLLKYATGNERY